MSGLIYENWQTEFKTWNRAVKQYLEMRDYYDIAAADWLFDAIHRMNKQTWLSHTEDMLSALEFGWSLGEITLEKRGDGRMWLRNIDPRGQDTLERWDFSEFEKDEVTDMVQRDPNTGQLIPIPLAKCVHTTFRGRKGNPEGHSLLLSLHWPYRQLRDAEVWEMIGIERDVGGMPVAKLPEEGNVSSTDITTLEAGLKGMRNDENSYLIAPPGVEIMPYGSSSKMYDIGAVIERKKKGLLMRMFAQFLMLGMDNVGTQALVQGSQSFFNLALKSVQEQLLEAWNLQLVPYLFSFNSFAGMTDLPKIIWTQPGQVDIASILGSMNQAVGAKIITPTDDDEDYLRDLMGLPILPEDERGMPRDVEAPAIPGLFDIKSGAK
jgi:hypothetical protein